MKDRTSLRLYARRSLYLHINADTHTNWMEYYSLQGLSACHVSVL